MFIRGIKNFIFHAIFLSLAFVHGRAHAQENKILPDICVDRAAEIGIYPGISDVEVTRKKLGSKNTAFDFTAISRAYDQTLKKINAQLENYRSPLFQYLQNCKDDEKSCHGYFRYKAKTRQTDFKTNIFGFPEQTPAKNPFLPDFVANAHVEEKKDPEQLFYLQIFCDAEIFRSAIESRWEFYDSSFQEAIKQPFDLIDTRELSNIDPASYSKKYFFQKTINGVSYLQNKSSRYVDAIENIVSWYDKFADISGSALEQSIIPEGTLFILQKIQEEFKDYSVRQSKINDLNHYYNTLELIGEFAKCCSNDTLSLPEFQLSAHYVNEKSMAIFSENQKPEALVFKPESYLSILIFEKAESEYWKDLFKKESPLAIPADQKERYLKYLTQTPFFFDQQTSFQTFIGQAKNNPEQIHAVQPGTREYAELLEKYKVESGYTPVKPSYDVGKYGVPPYPVPGLMPGATYSTTDLNLFDLAGRVSHSDPLTAQVMFNPDFSKDYKNNLQTQTRKIEQAQMETDKETYYPRIFKSLIHYQFSRVVKAKAIRELQKLREADAQQKLRDIGTFHKWVDQITCSAFETEYCSLAHDSFRLERHTKLYEDIIGGRIDLEYNPNPGTAARKYIYDQKFVDIANEKIKSINEYCWNVADPVKFKSDPNAFERAHGQDLVSKMDEFYSIPRMDVLLGQTKFVDVFKISPEKLDETCFSKGYAFGYPTLSDLGTKLITPMNAGYPGVVVFPDPNGLQNKPIKEIYIPSTFRISLDNLHGFEKHIESEIRKEFETLQIAFRYNDMSEYQDFLEESASVRIFAMMDYAIDNPSSQIGKYICHLIQESDSDEEARQKRIDLFTNIAFVSATTAAFLLNPPATAEYVVLYNAGTAIVITGISVGGSVYKIQYYNHKNNLVDMAVSTENIRPKDAVSLHETYAQEITNSKYMILANLALLPIISGKPIMESKTYIQNILDRNYNFIRRKRLTEIKDLVRKTSGQVEFQYHQKVEDFLFNYKKVTPEEFEAFKNALSLGKADADEFLVSKWPQNLERYIYPPPGFIARTWQQITLTTKNTPIVQKTLRFLETKSILVKPYFYQIKTKLNQFFLDKLSDSNWYKWYPYKQLDTETSIVQAVRGAKQLSEKTGKEIFTNDEITAFASKMKYYRLDSNGNFQRILAQEMETALQDFLKRSVVNLTPEIENYITGMLNSRLLNEEWVSVLQTFDRKITNIQDCRSLMKVIKFAKKEFATLRSQFLNAKELADLRELGGTYVYQKRTKEILEKINEFYDIAQYVHVKNQIRLADDLSVFFKQTRRNSAEVQKIIKEKVDPEFSYIYGTKDYGYAKKYVAEFEEKNPWLTKGIESWNDSLKYEKQFMQQEKRFNNYFHKQLARYLKTEPDPVNAYDKAWVKVRMKKQTEYDCALPDSIHRRTANQLYQNTAKKIALATSFMGYWANHSNEEKNAEWLTRFAYEIGISTFGSTWQSTFFTKKDGGPLYKAFRDLASGWSVNFLDGGVYTAANEVLWNKDAKYEAEFAKIIYESENVEETINSFFQGHPDIQQQILHRLDKVRQAFDEAELKLSKGTMVDSELEESFIKKGLIDNIFYSDMKKKDKELGDQYLYHEMMEDGYIDEDLYKNYTNDEDWRNQLIDLLTEINYQNLYASKSGLLKYPLLPTMNLGNHEYLDDVPFLPDIPFVDIPMEIRSGNETIDRIAFYTMYDVGKFPVAYVKNNLVYKVLCNFDGVMPGKTNEYAALAIHAVYKSIMDPMKFYLREQATGH